MPSANEIPPCPPRPTPAPQTSHSYDIELITPMFGGGVEPRVNDPSFPIRPTAIRGQLQFWWRATVGARYATLAELRAAHTEVWGSTERASRVNLLVDDVRAGEPTQCAKIEWNPRARGGKGAWRINWQAPFNAQDSSLSYALFPFQGETPPPNQNASVDVPAAACIQQASFRLVIQCPKSLWPSVEPAVWAWGNFGGLGGRTRRGCGTISCKALAPKDRSDLIRLCKPFVSNIAAPREWPTLAAAILVGVEKPDSISAWDHVIGRFKHFRQGVGLGRNGDNPKFPKRSRWPEPEAVRMTTEQRLPKHGVLNTSNEVAFPRAEFGLPIVFHFKDEDKRNPTNPNVDPEQTVLYPSASADDKKRERMASPLILKPLALQNGKAIPLILRLRTPDLESVDLRRGEASLNLPATTVVRDPRLSSYPNSPLAGSPNGSAIEAFLAFSRAEGFTEVTR